ncbi:MAG: sulfotransferase family protein [Steroidobacteraceae bacterium]
MTGRIIELECEFDRYLLSPRVAIDPSRAIAVAATRWSDAVWAAAEAEGPMELDPELISRGLDLARRPVFVCGAHRSGTTLVRDLLDAHPALAVLPAEGTFFTSLQRHLERRTPGQHLAFFGGEWLRRLANPIHQQPYWLLGRTCAERSPYVAFARCLMAWWAIAKVHIGFTASSWPLTAVALAYAQCGCGLGTGSHLRHWVEKTPDNERFLPRLRAEFPAARIIHVVRHPFAVLASHAQEARTAGERPVRVHPIAAQLLHSHRVAAAQADHAAAASYLLIRYEDLLASPPGTVARLAEFLGIAPLPILAKPTVAGVPAASNSSFRTDMVPGRIQAAVCDARERLDPADRARLTAVLGESARRLGYDLGSLPPWRRRMLRMLTWMA